MRRKKSEKRRLTDPVILVPIIVVVISAIVAPIVVPIVQDYLHKQPSSKPAEEPTPQQDIGRERKLQSLVPLNLYYSNAREDNFLTATDVGARSAKEAGYEYVRIEGYIYPDQQPDGNLVPLKLYYSNAREEFFTTATEEGISAADAAGYRLIGIEGFVYPNYFRFK